MRIMEQLFSQSVLLTVLLLTIRAQVIAVPGPIPGMEYVELPGGIYSFGRIEDQFGSVLSEGDSIHVNSFQIMTTEVTQGQWELVMGKEILNYILADAGVNQIGPEYPMCGISFIDCLDFVDSLNALDSLYEYRIPPYKYWEYAFRAGTGTPYFWGVDTLETMSLYCWYSLNSGDSLAPAGSRVPNTWGLFDMCGSVFEWCTYGTGIEVEDSITGRITRCQPLGGGSYLSTANDCRIDLWVPADSSSRYTNCGLRVARRRAEDDTQATGNMTFGQIVEYLQQEDRFAVFVEPVLAVGGIQHTFYEDDIEQFGYNVKGGSEQDAAYLRVGFGKYFGRFSAFTYGEIGHLGPGSLIDAHGPWIAPEVLLKMTVLDGGLELRYFPVRVRLGYGKYWGNAEVDYDYDPEVSPFPSGSWNTDILDGRGFHFAAGLYVTGGAQTLGLEWSQHFIKLKLGESGTGVEPSEHKATQYELRLFYNLQLPFTFGSIF